MRHRLISVGPNVEYQAIAASQTFLLCDAFRGNEKMTDQGRVLIVHYVDSGYRLPGDNQDMSRRYWADVANGKTELVLEDELCRNSPVCNFLK